MNIFKKFFRSAEADTPAKTEKVIPKKIDLETELPKALAQLEKFKHTAYLPITTSEKSKFSAVSKMGGLPYLRNINDWPVCPNCNKHMQLFLQLDLKSLPEKKDDGLLQFFYCTNEDPCCESDLEAFFPFSKGSHARIIKVEGDSIKIEPMLDELFPEKQITGWDAVDDYPHAEEYEHLGLNIHEDVVEHLQTTEIREAVQGDKLFGWPYWVQSTEYPYDRQTENQMQLLFQIDSEYNLPYMFGDSGVGHLTQSPDNRNELGFGWACH